MFSNNDVNKFIVLLAKGFYPHEYIDEWEKFNGETSLSEKELFCSLRQRILQMQIMRMQKDFVKTMK